MPKTTISCLLLAASLLAAGSPTFAAEYPENTLELYVKSGMAKQTLALSHNAVASVAQIEQQLGEAADTPDIFDDLSAAVEKAYDPEILRETFLKHLASLSPKDTETTLQWLNSPLGARITRLEEDASQYQSQPAIEAYASNLDDVPADPLYLGKIEKLMELLDITNMSVDLIANSQLVMSAAALAVNGTYNVDLLPELEAEVNAARPILEEPVRHQLTVGFLYTYHSLAPEELQAYLDFLASPSGKRYANAANEGFQNAILKASRRMGKSIGEALSSDRLKRPA